MNRFTALTLALLLISQSVFAQTATESKNKIYRSYESSVEGMTTLMEDLEKENPSVKEKLTPEFNKLKSADRTATILRWGGFIGGMGYAVSGFISGYQNRDDDSSGDKTMDKMLIGVGAYFACYIAAAFIEPSRNDYMKFINRHNEHNPDNQLHLKSQLNVLPILDLESQKYGLGLALNF